MNLSIPFFLALFAYLSFCSPKATPTARTSMSRSKIGGKTGIITGVGTNSSIGSSPLASSGGGSGGGASGGSGSGSGGGDNGGDLPNNIRGNDWNTDELVQTTTDMGWVAGNDCTVHINKPKGDLCRYDFCGDAAANSHLSAGEYQTVKALIDALKTQGKYPSGTCSNSNIMSALKNLETLNLSGKGLTDISPIQTLTLLKTLNLDNNQIVDLTPLMDMSSLMILYASNNKIKNLNALSSNTKLKEIYLSNNQLTSIEPLVVLPELVSLDISKNQVGSIINLTHRAIGINISDNPGILLEAETMKAVTQNPDPGMCAAKMFSNITSALSCTWNAANVQLNTITGNQPIPTRQQGQ